jgi:glycosyltransferase involved in cell wall biosynthesis
LGVETVGKDDHGHTDEVLRRYGISSPYVLALGSTEPRKNNERVIKAIQLLTPAHPNLQLAIAGKEWRGKKFRSDLLNDRIRLIGFVKDQDMPAIVGSAEMLVFASLCEGFGLPVIEGMVQGVPVVTSNVTSMPEVGGDAALYVDPYSVVDIAEKMGRVLCDSSLSATMRRKGLERAMEFQWKTTCSQIASVCASLTEVRR